MTAQPRTVHQQNTSPVSTSRKKAKRHKKPRYLPWLIGLGVMGVGFIGTLLLIGFIVLFAMMSNRIPAGVSVAGVPLNGMTRDEAASYLSSALYGRTISLTDGSHSWNLPLTQLGFTPNIERMAAELENVVKDQAIPVAYNVDLGAAQQGLLTLQSQVDIVPIPGGAPGRAMDIPVMIDRLRVDPLGEISDGVFELSMVEVEPPRLTAENYSGPPIRHVVETGQELALIAKEYGVSVDDILDLNNISNPDLLYIGQELKIPAPGVYEPAPEDAPPAPLNKGKSIVVSTEDQRIYAYEDGELVRSHLVSTGRLLTPTVKGDYDVYVKYEATDMSGPDYYLPNVPYTMYFYQGYGIHGTYWHNSFGRPMSHGCVNLPIDEAEWFFRWAQVGTRVRVV